MTTKLNPSTAEASRETDAAVARAMGYEVSYTPYSQTPYIIGGRDRHVPAYSTSYEGMGRALEHIDVIAGLSSRIPESGATWVIRKDWQTNEIQFSFMTPSGWFNGPYAPTAPLAVCRAILAWKGE